MQKWESKNGGTEPENQGPEPQSARAGAVETHFRIFWKNSKNHEKCIHFSSLFRFFFAPFSRLFGKSRKRGPGSGPRAKKYVKMDLKGAKTEPKNQQSTPQGPTKYKLPRPGARRRRRRSAAVPCTSCRRVGRPFLSILRLTSLRTDKVSSLGACTHLTF